MSKTIIVAGFGPGISKAVAERFGQEGFSVALVSRNTDRLAEGVKALEAKGIKAQGFSADLGQPDAAREMVKKVRRAMGPISVLQWTAYGIAAGDLTTADTAAIRSVFDVPVVGLLAAVQEALPDLRSEKGAVLVTNGGLGYFDPTVDGVAVQWNAMGLAVANSAKHKLVRVLSVKLKEQGIYVGEVMVTGTVKGTPFDQGNSPTLQPSTVAAKFWEIFQERKEVSVRV